MKRILVALALLATVIGSGAGLVAVATSIYSAPAMACDNPPCND